LRVFQKRALRGIFGYKRDEATGDNCIIRNFVIFKLLQILLG
jgi:hypothetical protein